ncbi:MAG: 50S ribosomal protein L6 [bacterium]
MSRIGKKLIPVPAGTTVTIAAEGITTKGPKGSLTLAGIRPGIVVKQDGDNLEVTDETGDKLRGSAFRGLYRSLLANNVQGVSTGFTKVMEFVGVGYRCAIDGKRIKLEVGYSMPKFVDIPEGVTATVEKNTILTLAGADKHQLGQLAANIRAFRPPEPYKGKGIKFQGEIIRRKAGKSSGK